MEKISLSLYTLYCFHAFFDILTMETDGNAIPMLSSSFLTIPLEGLEMTPDGQTDEKQLRIHRIRINSRRIARTLLITL